MAQTSPAVLGPVEPSVRPDDEACECRECEGQGGYDAWKAVAGHYEGGEVFRVQCDRCDGTGKVDDYGNHRRLTMPARHPTQAELHRLFQARMWREYAMAWEEQAKAAEVALQSAHSTRRAGGVC